MRTRTKIGIGLSVLAGLASILIIDKYLGPLQGKDIQAEQLRLKNASPYVITAESLQNAGDSSGAFAYLEDVGTTKPQIATDIRNSPELYARTSNVQANCEPAYVRWLAQSDSAKKSDSESIEADINKYQTVTDSLNKLYGGDTIKVRRAFRKNKGLKALETRVKDSNSEKYDLIRLGLLTKNPEPFRP